MTIEISTFCDIVKVEYKKKGQAKGIFVQKSE